MNLVRNIVAALAVLAFIASVVAGTIANITGGETTDSERDTLLTVFGVPLIVLVLLVKLLAPYEPKKGRRR